MQALKLKPGKNRATLKLARAVALEGEIVDDIGHAVPRAEIEARSESEPALRLSARADEQGRFKFIDAAAGASGSRLSLKAVDRRPGDILWLRYTVRGKR